MSLSKYEKIWICAMIGITLVFLLLSAFGFGRAYERKILSSLPPTKSQCMKYILEEQEKGYEELIKRLLK